LLSTPVIAANAINLTTETTVHNSSNEQRASGIENRESSIERIAAILDAKRSQFFIAVYQRKTNDERQAASDGLWKKFFPDSLMTASQFLYQFACKEKPVWLLGEGLLYYKDEFKAEGIKFLDEAAWYPKAAKVHLLGWQLALQDQFADPLALQPTYLRRPV